MTKLKTLKNLATKEAENLKKVATNHELAKLDIATFNPEDTTCCIYGQMTGHCNSARANELIVKCATRVYDTSEATNSMFTKCKLGGKPYTVDIRRTFAFISPIELIIYKDRTSGQKIINYLKDETKTLIL